MDLVAIDTETTGGHIVGKDEVFSIGIVGQVDGKYVEVYEEVKVDISTSKPELFTKAQIERIEKYTNDSKINKVFHSVNFDLYGLRKAGIKVSSKNLHCTLSLSHLFNSLEPHGLKELSNKYLNVPPIEELKVKELIKLCRNRARQEGFKHIKASKGSHYWLPAYYGYKEGKEYNLSDCKMTAGLFYMYQEKLKQSNDYVKRLYKREQDLIEVIYHMMSNGIKVDRRLLTRKVKDTEKRREEIEKTLEINLNSPKQLSDLLYGQLRLSTEGIKRTASGFSTDDASIKLLAERNKHCVALKLIKEAKISGSLVRYGSSYLKSLDEEDTLRSFFNKTGTNTTRLSSSRDNLQNIGAGKKDPDKPNLRTFFIPRKDHILIPIDYSQAEVRFFAYVSDEEQMLKDLDEGRDFHEENAKRLGISRRLAKDVVFGTQYGAGIARLTEILGSEDKAEIVKKAYNEAFPNAVSFYV